MKIKYLFALAFLVVLSIVSIYSFRDKAFSDSIFAQNNRIEDKKQKMNVRENFAAANLASLLSGQGISLDDTAILPARVENSQTILIRLESPGQLSPESDFTSQFPRNSALTLIENKESGAGLARQRNFELSPNQILIIAVNKDKQALWWHLQSDPRIVRAEAGDEAGKLSAHPIIYRNAAEMLVAIPSDDAITEIYFFHPNWNGQTFDLEKIGSLPLSPDATQGGF